MADITDNAMEILKARYFRKDPEGNIIEDWSGLCKRVADFAAGAESASAEVWSETYYDLMHSLTFLPSSPVLFNSNMPLGNLSACFVLPVGDSLEEIFDAIRNAAIIFATGGGCGYDFSELRKRGSPVSRTSGVSSGPVSFIQVFNAATEVIKQGGKRRGANMGILRVDHPDIEEFLESKREEGALANFTLSVAVTDKFMQAVEADGNFTLFDNYIGGPDSEVKAKELFDKIVEGAWSNGEPGVVFIDEINRRHPLKGIGKISGTNPCSEQPLLPNESCNLGSINLTKFFKQPLTSSQDYTNDYSTNIDWDGLTLVTKQAVRFLDDVLTVNRYPIQEIGEMSLRTRKIGLGVMGWADLLLMLQISYGSDKAVHLADRLMEWIQYHAMDASIDLARDRGVFPAYEEHYDPKPRPTSTRSSWEGTLDWDTLDTKLAEHGLRNACTTTIAPTGTLSLIAGVSSGIEPNFQWEYEYHRIDKEFTEIHWLARQFLSTDEPLPRYFKTSLEIEPFYHIKMQAVFQQWVDSGISKTINLPFEATREDVAEAIMLAWKSKIKGMTLYRSGSRAKEVLVRKDKTTIAPTEVAPRERPTVTNGSTMKVAVGDNCGSMFVTLNFDSVGPCESFIALGRGGGCISSHTEALGRMISLALRSGIEPKKIIDQLRGIRCSKPRWVGDGDVIRSCPDAVAFAFTRLLDLGDNNGENETEIANPVAIGENPECPECHGELIVEAHCLYCRACGYSKCG